MPAVVERMSFENVRRAKPTTIFYGVNTCWWTHRESDLYRHPECGLPCDPRGGMLMQTDNADEFLRQAEAHPEHYGRHGLRAFMAAHHQNCITGDGGPRHLWPTCLQTWEEYNALLDALEAPHD